MPCPGEALSKYGESDSAWRQNRPKALSLSGRKIEVVEGAVILGQNCCQVTAESGVFDCTSTPELCLSWQVYHFARFDIGRAGTDSKMG